LNANVCRRATSYLAALATFAGGLAFAGAPTAVAADGHRINARPERVVVNQTYERVRWSVRNRTGCLSDAGASLEHVGRRSLADYDFDTRTGNGLGGMLRLYDYERMGRYVVYGEGWNECLGAFGGSSSFSRDYITVKRAARVTLNSARHHRRVTLHAKVRRYAGGYRVWRNHRNARVTFQQRTPRGWKRISADRTNRRGVARVTIRRAKRQRFRAVVRQTPSVWARTSRPIRR
jgi:hypothetical protein